MMEKLPSKSYLSPEFSPFLMGGQHSNESISSLPFNPLRMLYEKLSLIPLPLNG